MHGLRQGPSWQTRWAQQGSRLWLSLGRCPECRQQHPQNPTPWHLLSWIPTAAPSSPPNRECWPLAPFPGAGARCPCYSVRSRPRWCSWLSARPRSLSSGGIQAAVASASGAKQSGRGNPLWPLLHENLTSVSLFTIRGQRGALPAQPPGLGTLPWERRGMGREAGWRLLCPGAEGGHGGRGRETLCPKWRHSARHGSMTQISGLISHVLGTNQFPPSPARGADAKVTGSSPGSSDSS